MRSASLLALVVALASCGGEPPPAVARIEIGPTALALTGAGDVRTIAGRAYAEDGSAIDAELVWSSTRDTVGPC